jgi:hypothetical protein
MDYSLEGSAPDLRISSGGERETFSHKNRKLFPTRNFTRPNCLADGLVIHPSFGTKSESVLNGTE